MKVTQTNLELLLRFLLILPYLYQLQLGLRTIYSTFKLLSYFSSQSLEVAGTPFTNVQAVLIPLCIFVVPSLVIILLLLQHKRIGYLLNLVDSILWLCIYTLFLFSSKYASLFLLPEAIFIFQIIGSFVGLSSLKNKHR